MELSKVIINLSVTAEFTFLKTVAAKSIITLDVTSWSILKFIDLSAESAAVSGVLLFGRVETDSNFLRKASARRQIADNWTIHRYLVIFVNYVSCFLIHILNRKCLSLRSYGLWRHVGPTFRKNGLHLSSEPFSVFFFHKKNLDSRMTYINSLQSVCGPQNRAYVKWAGP